MPARVRGPGRRAGLHGDGQPAASGCCRSCRTTTPASARTSRPPRRRPPRCDTGHDEHGRFTLHAAGPLEDGELVLAALDEVARPAVPRRRDRRHPVGRAGRDGPHLARRLGVDVAVEPHGPLPGVPAPRRRRRVVQRRPPRPRGGAAPADLRRGGAPGVRDRRPPGASRSDHSGGARRPASPVSDRDRVCRHPACANRFHLEIHHLVHWRDGGTTDPHNLLGLCGKHHRAHHAGEFTIAGNPELADGLTFTDRRGRPITGPMARPTRRTAAARRPVHRGNRRALRGSLVRRCTTTRPPGGPAPPPHRAA